MWNRLPTHIALDFVVALGSDYLIEKTFLSLRYRSRQPMQAASAVPGECS
jgi:hypothetical protein